MPGSSYNIIFYNSESMDELNSICGGIVSPRGSHDTPGTFGWRLTYSAEIYLCNATKNDLYCSNDNDDKTVSELIVDKDYIKLKNKEYANYMWDSENPVYYTFFLNEKLHRANQEEFESLKDIMRQTFYDLQNSEGW